MRLSDEQLLQKAPRWMEVTAGLAIGVLGLLMWYLLALWFRLYLRPATPPARPVDWVAVICLALISMVLTGLAIDLVRGRSRRVDGGLFSRAALRSWGIVFALCPLVFMATSRQVLPQVHHLLWAWSASVACFVLAARRSQRHTTGATNRPIE